VRAACSLLLRHYAHELVDGRAVVGTEVLVCGVVGVCRPRRSASWSDA
jgi:hypothetical protein